MIFFHITMANAENPVENEMNVKSKRRDPTQLYVHAFLSWAPNLSNGFI